MHIFSRLDKLIYGTHKKTFSSPYSRQEAVFQLARKVYNPSLVRRYLDIVSSTYFRKDHRKFELEGKVTEKGVFLARFARGFGRTTFRLVYRGRFRSFDDLTILEGSFSVAPAAKVISILWIVMILYFLWDFGVPAFQSGITSVIPFVFFFLSIMFLVLVAFIWYGRWVSRNAIQIMSHEICKAIDCIPAP